MSAEIVAYSYQKIMLFTPANLSVLASRLTVERKRQGLTRAQAASVCNVSASFIRDAESYPARCSLGRLLQYMTGLGLSVDVVGWGGSDPALVSAVFADIFGSTTGGHEGKP